jgi:hypothetical protein
MSSGKSDAAWRHRGIAALDRTSASDELKQHTTEEK